MPTTARLTVDSKIPGARVDQIWSTQGGWRNELTLLASNIPGITVPWPAGQLYCLMLFQPPTGAATALVTVKYQAADTGLQFNMVQNQDPQPVLIPKPNANQFILITMSADIPLVDLYYF